MSSRKSKTVARRLLGVLPRVGVTVTDVGPGLAVVSRRGDVRVLQIDDKTGVVTRRRGLKTFPVGPAEVLVTNHDVQVLPIDDKTGVVTRRRGLKAFPAGPAEVFVSSHNDVQVLPIDDKTGVVTRRRGLKAFPVGPADVLVTGRHQPGWLSAKHENGLYGHLTTDHVRTVLSAYQVDAVLDVGANKGQYASKLRKAGYAGWIVSFEPVAADFEVLAEKAEKDGRWSVHQIALGREDSVIEMNVVPGTLSSLLPATEFGSTRYERLKEPTVQQVQVRRLDGFLDEIADHIPSRRLYLKLDTQGYDLEAFAGLGDRVQDVVGMQSEVALLTIYEGMPQMAEALAVYQAAGFEITGMFPVSRERRTGRVLEFDCIMVRADCVPEEAASD